MIGLHTALILLKVVFSLVNTGVYLMVNTFIYMHAREYFEFKFDGIIFQNSRYKAYGKYSTM